MGKDVHVNRNQKRTWMAVLLSDERVLFKKNGYKRKKDIAQVNKVFDTAQRYSLKHPHTK